jgi:hypothetical protein
MNGTALLPLLARRAHNEFLSRIDDPAMLYVRKCACMYLCVHACMYIASAHADTHKQVQVYVLMCLSFLIQV